MILVDVQNPSELAAKQNGAAKVADALDHDWIVQQVDQGIRDQLATSLAANGVRANVTVITRPPASGVSSSLGGLVLAAGLGLLLGALAAS